MATGTPQPRAEPRLSAARRVTGRTRDGGLRGRGRGWPVVVAGLAAVCMLWTLLVLGSSTDVAVLGEVDQTSDAVVGRSPSAVGAVLLSVLAVLVALDLAVRWSLLLPWWGRAGVGAAGAFVVTVAAQTLAPLSGMDSRWFALVLLVVSVALAVARWRRRLVAAWVVVAVSCTALALSALLFGDPVLLWVTTAEIGLWLTVIEGSALVTGGLATMVWAVRHSRLPVLVGSRRSAALGLAAVMLVLLALVAAAYVWRGAFPAGGTSSIFRAHPATAVHALALAGLAHAAARSAAGRPVSVGWLVTPLVAAGAVLFVTLSLLDGLLLLVLLRYGQAATATAESGSETPAAVGTALVVVVFLVAALAAALRRQTPAALTALAGAAYLAGPVVHAVVGEPSLPIAANPVEAALAVTVLSGSLLVLRRGTPGTAATLAVTVSVVSLGSVVLSDGWFPDPSLPRVALAVSLFIAVASVVLRRRSVIARPAVVASLLGLAWLVLGLEPASAAAGAAGAGYVLLLGFPLGVAATTLMVGRRPWEHSEGVAPTDRAGVSRHRTDPVA